jgi:hypothetical protein
MSSDASESQSEDLEEQKKCLMFGGPLSPG